MYIPKWSSSADFNGAWDPMTSNLDWCESNYVWSYYVAEWWNTWSNLSMILPGLFGMVATYRRGAEIQFFVSFLSLFCVGMGSWFFHMTLCYPMQLVDELSMLYSVSILMYCAFEIKSERHTVNWPLAMGLTLLASGACAIYVTIGHPVFHQVTYCVVVLLLILKSIGILREYPRYWRLFAFGLVIYVAGVTVWKLDVHYCSELREVRAAGPFNLVPGLLELHAWWHILAGMGTYFYIVIMAGTRSEVLKGTTDIHMLLGVFPVLRSKPHTA